MRFLFCYDITSAKKLRRVSKFLEQKGYRIQRSFFICSLDFSDASFLLNELKKMINLRQDSLYMYGLCEKCQKNAFGIGDGAFKMLEDYRIL